MVALKRPVGTINHNYLHYANAWRAFLWRDNDYFAVKGSLKLERH